MKPGLWLLISFGMMLGVVVGMRLSMAGMLFVATFLTSSILLVPLFWWRAQMMGQSTPIEVFIERPSAKARGHLQG
jgi:hypothetical protein